MQNRSWALTISLIIGLLVGVVGIVSSQNLPVIKGKKVVATVAGELITLDEFNRDLALARGANKSEVLRRPSSISV